MDDSTTQTDDRLDVTFAALANTTRRRMLARLAEGDANVTDLAEPFDMSLPAISRHLKVLQRAGLVARGRNAQYRPCRLDAGPLAEVLTWAEQYRPAWEERLDRLDDYLHRLDRPDDTTHDSTHDTTHDTTHDNTDDLANQGPDGPRPPQGAAP